MLIRILLEDSIPQQLTTYPNAPKDYDLIKMNKVKNHAEKNKAILFYAGVGFAHANDYEKSLTKNDPYVVNFDGLQTII